MQPNLASSAEKLTPGMAALLDAVDRLDRLIDAETAALRRFQAIDLRDFNNRKSQILLELTRAVRALNGSRLDAEASSRLSAVRGKLAANQTVLATHLKAAKAITTLVADTLRNSESDGTYSNAPAFGNAAPW
jgi:hypothetical protein